MYLNLIKKFWSMNADLPLNSSISVIYLFLLEFWDKNGQKDFELSDTFVSIQLKISRPTINSAKKELRDLGLINYQVANGLPTFYKIITDYSSSRKTVKEKEGKKVAEKEKNTVPINKEKVEAPIANPVETKQQTEDIFSASETNKSILDRFFSKSPPPVEQSQNKEKENENIPTIEEFMEYAKTLEVYKPDLDFALKSKYETWKENNWLNGYGKPITNWRQSLKNTISFLKPNSTTTQKLSIPKITRPKATYNE